MKSEFIESGWLNTGKSFTTKQVLDICPTQKYFITTAEDARQLVTEGILPNKDCTDNVIYGCV